MNFLYSPIRLLESLYQYLPLINRMIRREVVGRYRGSLLGLAWSFFNPLIMLTVYTFVFSFVFRARWEGGSDSKTEFALALFIGMIAHGLIAECINRAPTLLLSNVSYVKKILFPLEILPWVLIGSALFHTVISLIVWILGSLLINGIVYWTVIFAPLVLLPLIFYSLGLSWFLSSLSVYVRDVAQVTGVFTTVLLFISPVFYSVSVLPEQYQGLLLLNPLTLIIEQLREVMMWGNTPDWIGLGGELLRSLLIACLGFVWFQKTRQGFADVL